MMEQQTYNPGAILFQEGDPSEHAFLLSEGSVEVLNGYPNAPNRLGLVGPGDVLGEMSLIDDRPRFHTARAVDNVTATRVTRDQFHQLLISDSQRCTRYLRSLFERLRSLEARVQELTLGHLEIALKSAANYKLTLFPLSRTAARVLAEDGMAVAKFPWRLGRASEADEREAFDLNDHWLLDTEPFHISRNHMLFDALPTGEIVVRDRGSRLGTIVNELLLGGKNSKRTELKLDEGENVVILGSLSSPWRFRVRLERT